VAEAREVKAQGEAEIKDTRVTVACLCLVYSQNIEGFIVYRLSTPK
jgi:hypothetical protein